MIEKGIPANLFLKEGGMEDLIKDFQKKVQAMIDNILKTFNLNPTSETLQKDFHSLSDSEIFAIGAHLGQERGPVNNSQVSD